jgi:hypothetical protein
MPTTIDAQRAKTGFTFKEAIAPGLTLEMELKKIYVSTQSDFQAIDILDSYYGKVNMLIALKYARTVHRFYRLNSVYVHLLVLFFL